MLTRLFSHNPVNVKQTKKHTLDPGNSQEPDGLIYSPKPHSRKAKVIREVVVSHTEVVWRLAAKFEVKHIICISFPCTSFFMIPSYDSSLSHISPPEL